MMIYVRLDIAALMAVAPWACICVWWGCPMMRQAWREADVPECPFYLSVLSKRGIAGHGWTARDIGGRRCNHHRGRIQPPDVAQTGSGGLLCASAAPHPAIRSSPVIARRAAATYSGLAIW
jgi:hypothetical protein